MPAARPAQRLVGGGGHELGVRHRARVQARRDQARDVGDVGHHHRAARVGGPAHGREVDGARVGARRPPRSPSGWCSRRERGHGVVVDPLVLLAHAVGDDLEDSGRRSSAGGRGSGGRRGRGSCPGWCRRACRPPCRPRCWPGRPSGAARWRGRQPKSCFARSMASVSDHVHELAAAVVALARIALGVLVGEHGAQRLQHRLGDEVLGGDQLELRALAARLVADGAADLGVGAEQGSAWRSIPPDGRRQPRLYQTRRPGRRKRIPIVAVTHLPVIVSKRGESARPLAAIPGSSRATSAARRAPPPAPSCASLGPTGRPLGFALLLRRSPRSGCACSSADEALPADLPARPARWRRCAWRETIAPGVEACASCTAKATACPSLVVDRYGDYLVVQTLSQATEARKDEIVRRARRAAAATRHPGAQRPARAGARGPASSAVGLLHGEVPETVEVERGRRAPRGRPLARAEDGPVPRPAREPPMAPRLRARARARRLQLQRRLRRSTWRRRRDEVLAVDVSDGRGRARRSATPRATGITNVNAREANVFDLLHELDAPGERFDTVILDPPAFAKSKDAVEKAAPRLQGDQPARAEAPAGRAGA